jgi:hypothetical protein
MASQRSAAGPAEEVPFSLNCVKFSATFTATLVRSHSLAVEVDPFTSFQGDQPLANNYHAKSIYSSSL